MNAVTKIEARTPTFFTIHPGRGRVTPVFAGEPRSDMLIDGLRQMYATGLCEEITLSSGDRVITAPKCLGPIGDDENKKQRAKSVGYFAVFKEPNDKDVVELDGDNLIEVIGPAFVVGPVQEKEDGGADLFPPVTLDQDALMKHVGWSYQTMRAKAKEMLEQALKGGEVSPELQEALAEAKARNAAVDRDDVTDEELAECGCPGCSDELTRRATIAGKH